MIFTLCIFFFYLRRKMEKKNLCKLWQFQHKRFEGGRGENHCDFLIFYHDSFSEYICKNIHQN